MKITDYVNALPDSYQKHINSNNYKLLQLEQHFISSLNDDIVAVQETLDLYSATGKTLDLYGAIYGMSRGEATDEQYRYLISQKVAQNMVKGDYNSIVNALAVVFNVPVTSFQFRETENPCEVEVLNLPLPDEKTKFSYKKFIGLHRSDYIKLMDEVLKEEGFSFESSF